MPVESTGQSGAHGLALPAGTRERLAWRPPALRAAHVLLSETPYSFSALQRAGRWLELHDRLAHRFRPWLAWEQPRLKFGAENLADQVLMTSETGPGWAARQPVTEKAAGIVPHDGRLEQPEGPGDATPPAVVQTQGVSARQPEEVTPLRLPYQAKPPGRGMLLERPVATEEIPLMPDPHGETPHESAHEGLWDLVFPTQPLLSRPQWPEPLEGPLPRIQLSVSPIPRREAVWGTPPSEPVVRDTVTAIPMREEEAQSTAATEASTPGWEAARQSIAASALRTQARPVGQLSERKTMVEKIIERKREPVPLPGLEIRIVRPVERETADERTRVGDTDRSIPSKPAPPPPAAPQLDINAVADRVYQTLLGREQFERERKGLY